MEKECEFQFSHLDSTFEPKLTLEFNLIFFESVLVPEPISFETKSTILPSHILFLDQCIDHNDSEIIFQDWPYNRDDFNVGVLHDPIHLGGL